MLTNREREAAAILAEGCGRTELADRLAVSLSAADKLVRSLKTKLDAPNVAGLALRCRELIEAERQPGPIEERVNQAPEAGDAGPFSDARTIEELFARLIAALEPLGITHVVYSHIRRREGEPIEHIASRWSFPASIPFDYDIPADHNPAFQRAMAGWAPTPLDLEAMAASEHYALVPEPIRRQNDVFIEAGMARGVVFVLPGLGLADRLMLSTLLRHASVERFAAFVSEGVDQAHAILMAFRHAHLALARPRVELSEREGGLVAALAAGRTMDEAAAAVGVSRRGADRALAALREATGSATNIGAVAAILRDRAEPTLPF